MKKFLALIMALAMIFALVACGQTEGTESNESIDEIIVVSSEESTTNTSSDAPSTTTPPTSSQQTTVACTHKNVQVTPAVEADCGKEGKTEGKVCKDCGAVIVASQTIPKSDQHYFTAATTEKPATCTVCGLTKGGVKEEALPAYIANATKNINGATISFSIKEVKYVENKTKCNIIYHVTITNGSFAGNYSWTLDVGTGDTGSIIAGGITASTPNSLAPNETFEQDFETGPINTTGNFGYRLTFK